MVGEAVLSTAIQAGLGKLFGGGGMTANKQLKLNLRLMHEQERIQRDFAQNGIQWKAADAKAAGISPLVAMGAQTFNPAVTPVGFDAQSTRDDASWLANAGADISRAADSTATENARLQNRMLMTQIEGQEIENAAKRSQLMKLNAPGTPPPFPSSDRLPVSDDYDLQKGDLGIGGIPSQELANVMGNDQVSNVMVQMLRGWDNAKYFARDVANKMWRARNSDRSLYGRYHR